MLYLAKQRFIFCCYFLPYTMVYNINKGIESVENTVQPEVGEGATMDEKLGAVQVQTEVPAQRTSEQPLPKHTVKPGIYKRNLYIGRTGCFGQHF